MSALALAGCSVTPLVAVPDAPLPIEAVPGWPLRDIAPLGAACEIGPDGWPLATHLTARDSRAYVEQNVMLARGQQAVQKARD